MGMITIMEIMMITMIMTAVMIMTKLPRTALVAEEFGDAI